MSREAGQFWIRNHMKTDVVWNLIFPEPGSRLLGSLNAVIRNNYINAVFTPRKMLNDIGSVLLHASQHKRVNSVRSEYNVQSACKLPQLGR